MEVIFKDDDAMEEIISVLEARGALAEHDKQIRAEIVDEFKNVWDSRVKYLISWCKDIRLVGLQQADFIFDEIAQQLKEQK